VVPTLSSRAPQLPPLRFPSPSTSSRWWVATYIPRFTIPWVPLPPQRFARSRGFSPPTTCRPCFMPVPPMGFFPFRALRRPQSDPLFRASLPSCGFRAPILTTASIGFGVHGLS
jgi:hypothetical protein